ncbi:MAG: hypothetical protein ACJ789_01240 [Thermomicrobiales bacterium]
MQAASQHRLSRRVVVGSSAAALLMLNARQVTDTASAIQIAVQGGGGAAGGGTIQLGDGTAATFSVFATRLTVKGSKEPLILGTVLVSAGGKRYASTNIADYGPIQGSTYGREITGTMTIDGSGKHPFHVNMPDLGEGDFGTDTFGFKIWDQVTATTNVDVTPTGEPIFNFEGPLTTGDIQLVDLKFTK